MSKPMMMMITVSEAEHEVILLSLRAYQQTAAFMAAMDANTKLDEDDIDTLCERINCEYTEV